MSPENPLTVRVTVNRYWQLFFGMGLVKTSEDFGIQGEKPSHPELLDWLATEFVSPTQDAESHPKPWDVKAILDRLIVTSATYRQSSRVTPELLEEGPGKPVAGLRGTVSAFVILRCVTSAGGERFARGQAGRRTGEAVSARGDVGRIQLQ